MKKKLAIISSYNELCGNATYTHALKKEFLNYYDVDVIPLKVNLLTSEVKSKRLLAERHILDIANKIKNYDFVNIQFEAGLFGVKRDDILRRVSILVRASSSIIVTMHRLDAKAYFLSISTLKSIKNGSLFDLLKKYKSSNYYAVMYEKIVKIVKDASKLKNASILVHTPRDKEYIRLVLNFNRVHDHPITFLTEGERNSYESNSREYAIKLRNRYKIKEKEVIIGIFGFISAYKGHDIALEALNYLPHNYKLLVFGSQHPHSIEQNQPIDPYIKTLVNMVRKDSLRTTKDIAQGLKDRVIFCGSLDDEEFISSLYGVDFSVLPYLETNQSGSGIASLTLETKVKSIFSQNLAFFELDKYAKNCFKTFSIGNAKELSDAILHYDFDYSQNLDTYFSKYNISSNVKLHVDIFEGRV